MMGRFRGWIVGKQSVRSYAEPAPAEARRKIRKLRVGEVKEAVVDNDKVIARSIHFCKLDDEPGPCLLHGKNP
jgi:hypothetical protein